MHFGSNRGEGKLGKRLSNTNDSFKLTDGNRDGRTTVGLDLSSVDLTTDGNKVRRELLGSFRTKSRGTSTIACQYK